ncbi:MAG: hypothetical protein Kow0031_39990 [Anaerolineae bacterium]
MTYQRRLFQLLASCAVALALTVTVLGSLQAMAQTPPPDGIGIAACPAGPSFSFTPTNPDPHQTVQFSGVITSTGGGGTITYTWSFGDGSALANSQKPNHAYIRSGLYTVVMTVSGDSCATTPTASRVITVGFGVPATILYFPLIFKNYFDPFPATALETASPQPLHGR